MSLTEYKLNEKEILKILTEVFVTKSEAEIVSIYSRNCFLNVTD